MDKRLVIATAGSGKTTYLVNQVDPERRSLVVTYTNENIRNLRNKISQRFGCIPSNVALVGYFPFLYAFCFRPILGKEYGARGMIWDLPPVATRTIRQSERQHYATKKGRLYHNRLAKLLIKSEKMQEVRDRMEKYYDDLFIDEVQDFAGNDFNLLLELGKARLHMVFVGDYHQHTFDTSRDGNVRKNLHKKGLDKYLKEFRQLDIQIDQDTLRKSYRCTPQVCEFIAEQLGISIESKSEKTSRVVYIEDRTKANELFLDGRIVKLFYQNQHKFDCYSNNWAKSKGVDEYGDVCVVLNKKTDEFYAKGKIKELPEQSKNAFYVACSRARGDLYLVPDHLIKD